MSKKWFDRVAKLALLAVLTLLYGVLPMFAFGWLLASIARHPEVVTALKNECAYRYPMWWLGGAKWVVLWFSLVAAGSLFCGIERVAREFARHAEPAFIPRVREGVITYTLKPFFSALAFIDGLVVDDLRLYMVVFAMGLVLSFWSLHPLKSSES
ncbi:hypothetical protein P3T43_006257 [Paraburkholderia sp. GAS41]|uniref:hypothetical protein n=1 Tax=Paraburkholderia sp. GAS41 TaxID=3035134 RepID=UPI003D209FF2